MTEHSDIPAPTPADDVIEHQERVEFVIDKEIAEYAATVKTSWLTGYLGGSDHVTLSADQASGGASVPFPMTIDTSEGTDITAGVTPHTLHLKKGVYLIQAQCSITTAASAHSVTALLNSGENGAADGANLQVAGFDDTQSGHLSLTWPPQFVVVTSETDTNVPSITLKGFTAGDSVSGGGFDIVKIA